MRESRAELYRRTQVSPSLEARLPGDVGDGHIARIRRPQGVSLSAWEMHYHCKVENVTLEASAATDSAGGLVGAGKEMMEVSDVMSSFVINDCAVSGTIIGGGAHVDAVVGDPACAVSIACEGGMSME